MLINQVEVPSFESPPAFAEPSGITALHQLKVDRRLMMKGLLVSGMTLGATIVGWIPLARPAAATVGTEHSNCTIYAHADHITCSGAPYGSYYCGSDKWFKNGCYRQADGLTDCFTPAAVCNGRNAWRWNGYRCADGYYRAGGTGTNSLRICSARL